MAAARKKKSNTKRPSKVSPTEETGVRWPTQKELFDAAIELAKANDFHRDEANHFVRKALWLWLESDRATNIDNRHEYLEPRIEDYPQNEEGRSQYLIDSQRFHDDQPGMFDAVNSPKEYPLNLDSFLAHLFPKQGTDKRKSLYRQYLSHTLRVSKHQADGIKGDLSKTPKPTSTEIAKLLARDKQELCIKTEDQFRHKARRVMEWYVNYRADSKKKRAATAAMKRHSNKSKPD
jgi:hypothetical protein